MIGGRTLVVAALIGGAIAIVLLGWYRAGVREVDGQIASSVEAVEREARDREAALASALTARLEELRATESARPYLHYQNLFHDPAGGSEGLSVTPSPLATGPADPLVALHFQIDERGAVSSPSVNDELPEAVQAAAPDRAALAAVATARAALEQVAARGAVRVAVEPTTQVAVVTPRRPSKGGGNAPVANEPQTQTIELPPEAYLQNQNANQIFAQTRNVQQQAVMPPPPQQQRVQGVQQQGLDEQQQLVTPPEPGEDVQQQLVTPPQAPTTAPVVRRPRRTPTPAPTPPPVVITVAPLVWTTATVDGAPTLIAVRQVVTPDGARTQGLTVTEAAVKAWLEERDASDVIVAPAGGAALGVVASPWTLHVDASAAAAYARSSGAMLRDGFLIKFVPVAVLAIVCGLLVVGVTARGEKLAQERARFAAAAAHELRTPLAGIQLYGDMLAGELGDPAKHKDYAHRIAVEASRLGRVVANVMGVSQLERGALAVRTERADAVDVVTDAIERARPGLERAGATVELVASAPLPAQLDRDAVARILGNLLDNAEKYSRDAADRTITVTVASAASGTHVEIAVRDRGPGLPAALRRGRFRAFRRAAGDDAPAGLGLGLALSQALAVAMAGELTARTVSPGAELVLRLPTA